MSLKIGNTGINKIYLGNSEINKAYLGGDLVYSGVQLIRRLSMVSQDRLNLYDNINNNGIVNGTLEMQLMFKNGGVGGVIDTTYQFVDQSVGNRLIMNTYNSGVSGRLRIVNNVDPVSSVNINGVDYTVTANNVDGFVMQYETLYTIRLTNIRIDRMQWINRSSSGSFYADLDVYYINWFDATNNYDFRLQETSGFEINSDQTPYIAQGGTGNAGGLTYWENNVIIPKP